jgi:hypothetical protein
LRAERARGWNPWKKRAPDTASAEGNKSPGETLDRKKNEATADASTVEPGRAGETLKERVTA